MYNVDAENVGSWYVGNEGEMIKKRRKLRKKSKIMETKGKYIIEKSYGEGMK